jgi:hypothetical protein
VAVHIGFSAPQFFAGILSRFPKLLHLELVYHQYESLNQVFALLRHCPALISLRMRRIGWLFSSEPIDAPSRSIRTLQIWHFSKMDILDIFLRIPEPNYTTVSLIGGVPLEYAPVVQRFLHALGPVLEDLIIGSGLKRNGEVLPSSVHYSGSFL